jgi:transcriptional regulator with XRE-family HTH domain
MAIRRLRLAQRRKALGHSQDNLAALVGVDRSTVIRWERAETDPQPGLRRILAIHLRVTPAELLEAVSDVPTRGDGYTLLSSVPLDFSLLPDRTVQIIEGFSAHDLISRREVLERLSILSSAAVLRPVRQWIAATPTSMTSTAAGPDELDALADAVRLFRRWDASGVGGLMRKAVVGQLNAVAETVRDTNDEATLRTLFQIMAELAQLAGWMAYDHGLPGIAQRYYVLALHACQQVGSGAAPLGAKVIGDMTQLSASLGNYEDSLGLARAGLYALPRSSSNLVRSELLGLESRAYAQLGSRESRNAARSAEACVEVWHDAADADQVPDWIHYMNQAEVECLAANSYTQLALQASDPNHWRKYPERAEHHTLQARQARSEGYDRTRSDWPRLFA